MGLEPAKIVQELIAERDRLFSYIWAIVGDIHLAEDVFQEVSLLVVEKNPNVDDVSQLRVWFRRAARLKALEAVRRKKRGPLLNESVLDKLEECWSDYDAAPDSELNELLDMLRDCMRLLTPYSRRLLVMHYTHGLRSSEIARRLKLKVETVYQAIARAHRSLSECIKAKLAAKERADE